MGEGGGLVEPRELCSVNEFHFSTAFTRVGLNWDAIRTTSASRRGGSASADDNRSLPHCIRDIMTSGTALTSSLSSSTQTGGSAFISMSQPAYLKAILHAARYPASPILGVLLGRINRSAQRALSVSIIDSLPLFHHYPVGPLIELSLLQAEAIARGQDGVVVLGVYVASEAYDRKDVSSVALKMANKMNEYNGTAVILAVSTRTSASHLCACASSRVSTAVVS
jgi:hypothetical protein